MCKKLRESEGSRATLLLIVGGMLALAVWASMTPANAAFMCNGADIWHRGPLHCMGKCERELWNTANLWDSTRNKPWSCPPLLQACVATCVKAKQAAQR
jgi:hypothetical protein